MTLPSSAALKTMIRVHMWEEINNLDPGWYTENKLLFRSRHTTSAKPRSSIDDFRKKEAKKTHTCLHQWS